MNDFDYAVYNSGIWVPVGTTKWIVLKEGLLSFFSLSLSFFFSPGEGPKDAQAENLHASFNRD